MIGTTPRTTRRHCIGHAIVFQSPVGSLCELSGVKGIAMLTTGKATKVTVYLSDGAKHKGVPVYTGVLDFLFKNGVAGATVCKGVAGFGAGHRIHAAHILELSDHLPIKIEFIDSTEKVERILPALQERCGCGLIEMQETSVIVPVSS